MAQLVFEGKGCVISQAMASMLAEHVVGRSLDDVLALHAPTIIALLGIELGPTRLKCALLPLEALQAAVRHFKQQSYP